MGWCGATLIFDEVCESLLTDRPNNPKETITKLYEVLKDLDWDCENESDFIDHPTVREAFVAVDPDWEEYFKEMDEQ